ncbi:MAG: hypothetical protein QOE22_514 [Candidatus Parcubacteria bacterium]|jgi:hypothetical protein|nr:hypothetical protein [Candidatus Parcubacteria bacterium]
MDREDIMGQYDRFIEQARTEEKDLYWLYNFFFVIQSALVVSAFTGRVGAEYLRIAEIAGFLAALYWLLILRKQRLWRNYWFLKIQTIEQKLDMPSDFQMFPPKAASGGLAPESFVDRRGVWRLLFLLPIGFAVLWAILFLGI